MKIKRILAFFSVFVLCLCSVFLSACDDKTSTEFNPDNAVSVLDKLEVEDDNFFNAISTKYNADQSAVKLETLISAMEEMNKSIKNFISSFSSYKSMFSSENYKNIFTYDSTGFKYEKDLDLVSVVMPKDNIVLVKTADDESSCIVEAARLGDNNFAIKYFVKESDDELGEEILCYFMGSSGRISSKPCLVGDSASIADVEDFSTFATDVGVGYYFYT